MQVKKECFFCARYFYILYIYNNLLHNKVGSAAPSSNPYPQQPPSPTLKIPSLVLSGISPNRS